MARQSGFGPRQPSAQSGNPNEGRIEVDKDGIARGKQVRHWRHCSEQCHELVLSVPRKQRVILFQTIDTMLISNMNHRSLTNQQAEEDKTPTSDGGKRVARDRIGKA